MIKMRAIQGVSYPRSGHAAVFQIAGYYFGDAFVYCDANNTDFCGCGSVPCVNPKRTFSKNHDFGLLKERNLLIYRDPRNLRWPFKLLGRRSPKGHAIIPSERYFIQYRNPVHSITSDYKLYLKEHPQNDQRSDWERFALRSMIYWNRFIDKWVLSFPSRANPPFYCTYEALIADPQTRVREILTYFSDAPLDENRVEETMCKYPITDRRSLLKFKFYDPEFFRKMENFASGRLQDIGLPSFETSIQEHP